MIRACIVCGGEFEAKGTTTICSDDCRRQRHCEHSRRSRDVTHDRQRQRKMHEAGRKLREEWRRRRLSDPEPFQSAAAVGDDDAR